jgi:hypothetical protein
MLQQVDYYIKDILGVTLHSRPISKEKLDHLPLFIRETYKIYFAQIFDQPLVLAVINGDSGFSTLQVEKHMDLIKNNLGATVVLVSDHMTAISRRRLIEKRINFIVPGKQLFIPHAFLDLTENFSEQEGRKSSRKLLPSAQYILLYHLLPIHDKAQITGISFKKLADALGPDYYTQMTISNAVENLQTLDLCKVLGTKEKSIHFEHKKRELWEMAQPYLINPVLKRIYVDEKPELTMLHSNLSALHVYSELNPSSQEYYAITKTSYFELRKHRMLINENSYEGRYCLEVWKYYPINIEQVTTAENVVDPLSLYLSLRDTSDERVEMALNQIIEKYVWYPV